MSCCPPYQTSNGFNPCSTYGFNCNYDPDTTVVYNTPQLQSWYLQATSKSKVIIQPGSYTLNLTKYENNTSLGRVPFMQGSITLMPGASVTVQESTVNTGSSAIIFSYSGLCINQNACLTLNFPSKKFYLTAPENNVQCQINGTLTFTNTDGILTKIGSQSSPEANLTIGPCGIVTGQSIFAFNATHNQTRATCYIAGSIEVTETTSNCGTILLVGFKSITVCGMLTADIITIGEISQPIVESVTLQNLHAAVCFNAVNIDTVTIGGKVTAGSGLLHKVRSYNITQCGNVTIDNSAGRGYFSTPTGNFEGFGFLGDTSASTFEINGIFRMRNAANEEFQFLVQDTPNSGPRNLVVSGIFNISPDAVLVVPDAVDFSFKSNMCSRSTFKTTSQPRDALGLWSKVLSEDLTDQTDIILFGVGRDQPRIAMLENYFAYLDDASPTIVVKQFVGKVVNDVGMPIAVTPSTSSSGSDVATFFLSRQDSKLILSINEPNKTFKQYEFSESQGWIPYTNTTFGPPKGAVMEANTNLFISNKGEDICQDDEGNIGQFEVQLQCGSLALKTVEKRFICENSTDKLIQVGAVDSKFNPCGFAVMPNQPFKFPDETQVLLVAERSNLKDSNEPAFSEFGRCMKSKNTYGCTAADGSGTLGVVSAINIEQDWAFIWNFDASFTSDGFLEQLLQNYGVNFQINDIHEKSFGTFTYTDPNTFMTPNPSESDFLFYADCKIYGNIINRTARMVISYSKNNAIKLKVIDVTFADNKNNATWVAVGDDISLGSLSTETTKWSIACKLSSDGSYVSSYVLLQNSGVINVERVEVWYLDTPLCAP